MNTVKAKSFTSIVAHGARAYLRFFVMFGGRKSLTPPGWGTNPSQVNSQQTLEHIYLPRKDRKLS